MGSEGSPASFLSGSVRSRCRDVEAETNTIRNNQKQSETIDEMIGLGDRIG